MEPWSEAAAKTWVASRLRLAASRVGAFSGQCRSLFAIAVVSAIALCFLGIRAPSLMEHYRDRHQPWHTMVVPSSDQVDASLSPPPGATLRQPRLYDSDFLGVLDQQMLAMSTGRGSWQHSPVLADTRKIYQTAKTLHHDSDLRANWKARHPSLRYEFIHDDAVDGTVRIMFRDAPAVLTLFDSLPRRILKLDLLRLLIVWAEGGLYTDTDTSATLPMLQWPISPLTLMDPKLELVVGVEIDELGASAETMRSWRWPHRFGFLQWTIWGRRHSDVLRQAVLFLAERYIVFSRAHGVDDRTSIEALHDIPISDMDILQISGPGSFTAAISRYLKRDDQLGGNYTIEALSGLREPTVAGSVLVLPTTYWSPGVGHSGAGGEDDPHACVRHHFHGSWNSHDRP